VDIDDASIYIGEVVGLVLREIYDNRHLPFNHFLLSKSLLESAKAGFVCSRPGISDGIPRTEAVNALFEQDRDTLLNGLLARLNGMAAVPAANIEVLLRRVLLANNVANWNVMKDPFFRRFGHQLLIFGSVEAAAMMACHLALPKYEVAKPIYEAQQLKDAANRRLRMIILTIMVMVVAFLVVLAISLVRFMRREDEQVFADDSDD